jgi:hypothetical protein
MATNGSEDPPTESGCTFYLVSSSDEVDSYATNLEEQIDNVDGIQARVSVSDCTSNDAYDTILCAAKDGSRWGKDLDKTLLSFIYFA